MADPALIELAERVEKATGPDRELDARIAVAIKFGCRANLPDDLEHLSAIRADDYEAAHRRTGHYWFHCRSGTSMRSAPPFTGSLDAAMMLPDGQQWGVEHFPGCSHQDGNTAAWVDNPVNRIAGHSPAHALTAASLRARAEQAREP